VSRTVRAERRARRARSRAGRVWRLRLPYLPDALAVQRRQLDGLTARWALTEDETFRLMTVVTELVSNAIDHARTPCRVTVRLAGSVLRVLVTDHSDAPPRLQPRDPRTSSGKGLQLIDALAAQWGWTANRRGKTVWASIAHAHP
jgi:anti-sigma regulatory factor (Ser/Thr protein kinase)